MSAFMKTLFGDAGTVAVVLLIMAAEALLVFNGQVTSAAFAVPLLVLIGAAWLARR
jgi:uncharacterized protein (TIGR03382 family)